LQRTKKTFAFLDSSCGAMGDAWVRSAFPKQALVGERAGQLNPLKTLRLASS
jgi:hypothetical protein